MSKNTKIQVQNAVVPSITRKKRNPRYLIDALIIIVMGALLFMGCWAQNFRGYSDVARYQCYALAFLQNVRVARLELPSQCDYIFDSTTKTYTNAQIAATLRTYGAPNFLVHFVASQHPSQPFHSLPHEYPILTLIPFLLVVFAPYYWYQVAFAILMILLAATMYFLLAHFKSRQTAFVGVALLVIGGWGTVAGRFDLLPSLLTLVAVILAERKRWTWAFVMLGLAFLLKFYPVMLLMPFLLAQQMDVRARWYAWRRWRPFVVFIVLCVLVMAFSFLLSVEGTIAPLSYFQARPIQAESFGSSLIWLSTFVQYHPMSFEFTYGSLNVVHIYSSFIGNVENVLEIAGLCYVVWLQWRRKIDLAAATLLTLLVVMVTGKIFSPQYLIWVVPLVAYVGGANRRWIVAWIAIGALTTFIYPYIYDMAPIVRVPFVPWFYPAVTLRNFVLFGFVLGTLISYSKGKSGNASTQVFPTRDPTLSYHPAIHDEEQA
jgi:Glycosyltransferase family 87